MKNFGGFRTHELQSWNVYLLAATCVLGMAMCWSNALAQSGAGSIQGTVTDSTGAVIPGAAIQVINEATHAVSSSKSNGVGFYQVPNLFTGTYIVTYSAQGMKTYTVTVELQVAQSAVVNPVLTAGAATQQVVVSANIVQLTNTETGTIASTLENNRISQLPENGRALVTLVGMTTPGLEAGGTRANGLMGEALEYVADGVPLTNRQFGGEGINTVYSTQAQLPDPDAVQEVHIETSDSGAQFATPATAVVTTKSGTDQLHGTLFETARNNAWGIAKSRQNPAAFAAPRYIRNEFGASAGGPIVLPHLYNGKSKSFWFFAYERYSLSQSDDTLAKVPTVAMRGGDFSQATNASGVLQTIYDPATTQSSANCNGTGTANQWCRTPFLNNQISPGRIAPASKLLYSIMPAPTSNDDPYIQSNLDEPIAIYEIVPTITFRLDHNFSENDKAYLRYTSNIQSNQSLRGAPVTVAANGFPAGANGYQENPITNYGAALGYTHVFSPSFFAETILSQQWFAQAIEGGGNHNLSYEKTLGLPNNFGNTGFPGISGQIGGFGGTQFNYQMNQIISNLDENLHKTAGKHEMQFGGRYRHERFAYLPSRYSDHIYFGAYATGLEDPTSKGNYSNTPNSGVADGDFFLGAAYEYDASLEPPDVHYHDMELDAYFQDDYHVRRNLTFNLGLRYEAHPAIWTKDGLTADFDFKNDAVVMTNPTSYYISKGYTTQAMVTNLENIGVIFEKASDAGFPSTMINNYDFTFGPRLGFAYQPFGNRYGTVIRGGYGMYIYPIPVRSSYQNAVTRIPYSNIYSHSYVQANQSPDGLPNYLLRSQQTVYMGQNSSNVVDTSTTNAILPGVILWALDPHYAPDNVTEVNATIEQSLKGHSALRVTWEWTHGKNLDDPYYINNQPSTFVWEMQTGTTPPKGGASVIGTPLQNTYAATAMGPYNQTTYGGLIWDEKSGWSNDNALQVNYQRLFHHGSAYQIEYVWSKAFRVGGNSTRDGVEYPTADYLGGLGTIGTMTSPYGKAIAPTLPPGRPSGLAPYADWHGLGVFENYAIDSAIPMQHIRSNGIVDIPVGRGKKFLSNSNRVMDELVGGWQLAGDADIVSQVFQPAFNHWGSTSPIHVYKHKAPITDCRSGVCHKSYLWFNGYLPPSVTTNCTKNCVTGLPSDYQPYLTPIDNTPGDKYYGLDEVQVTLQNGTQSPVAYSPGPVASNPYSHTFLRGPINWTTDLSLFKVFPITERVNLRFNMDAFNAMNVQGYNNPNTTDGTEAVEPNGVSSSANASRQIQFTMRLTF